MGKLRSLLRQTLLAHFWRQAKNHYFQKHVLPVATEATLNGVRLDISKLSPRMKEVILSGEYESAEASLCRQTILPGDRILELGGAIGFVGLFCLRNLHAAEVVSAEPNPRTAAILRRNFELNHCSAAVEEVAISDRDGTLNLCISDEFWGDNAFAANGTSAGSYVRVPSRTVGSLLKDGRSGFSVLISDIEGAETLIDWSQLPPSIDRIIIELHPGIVGYASAYGVLHKLAQLGFSVSGRINEVFSLSRQLGGAIPRSSEQTRAGVAE